MSKLLYVDRGAMFGPDIIQVMDNIEYTESENIKPFYMERYNATVKPVVADPSRITISTYGACTNCKKEGCKKND